MRKIRTLLVCLALAGCAAPDKPTGVPVDMRAGFKPAGSAPLPDQWWRSFDDPILNNLVEEALARNFDLRTAFDRLAQARATARVEAAALVPLVQATGGGTRSRRERRVEGASSGGGQTSQTGQTDSPDQTDQSDSGGSTSRRITSLETEYRLGLSASYELDLWGRLRSSRDAAVFEVKASAEDLQTAALTLSASVADTWYRLVEQRAQIDLLEAQIELNENVTKLVTVRFRQGQAGALDVFQQRQLADSNSRSS